MEVESGVVCGRGAMLAGDVMRGFFFVWFVLCHQIGILGAGLPSATCRVGSVAHPPKEPKL